MNAAARDLAGDRFAGLLGESRGTQRSAMQTLAGILDGGEKVPLRAVPAGEDMTAALGHAIRNGWVGNDGLRVWLTVPGRAAIRHAETSAPTVIP